MFSVGGSFLFGTVAGYAIEKVMKIAAFVVGLFVVIFSYLSYRGWIDVRWIEIENVKGYIDKCSRTGGSCINDLCK